MRASTLVPALSLLLAATGCPVVAQAAPAVESVTPTSGVTTAALASGTNVIVVVVDDANDVTCSRLPQFLPKVSALMRDQGACFENATTSSPLCAPSRASLQTGQLGHNSGVSKQRDAPHLRIQDTIQDDLSRAGWTTYGTGKFFNGISPWEFESGARSSGFDSSDFWASSKYYDYELWDDTTQTHHRPPDRVNATTRTGEFLRSFIQDQTLSPDPFYAYVAFKTPHTDNSATTEAGRLPQPTPANAQRKVPPFRFTPEADRRDKLPVFRKKLSSRASLERLYTARTRAMYDVDDEMGKTFDLLRSTGELDNTAIFFTSDHGYHLGENGWETKGDPYPRAMNVPLLAYLPGTFGAGRVVTRPVGLVDVAPTIHDIVGTTPGHRFDGRSLLSSYRRTGTFSELENERNGESGRAVSLRANKYPGAIPTWAAYRQGKRMMVAYYRPNGTVLAREFYADSGARRNLLWKGVRKRPSPKVLAAFRAKINQGRRCAGTVEQGARNPCP